MGSDLLHGEVKWFLQQEELPRKHYTGKSQHNSSGGFFVRSVFKNLERKGCKPAQEDETALRQCNVSGKSLGHSSLEGETWKASGRVSPVGRKLARSHIPVTPGVILQATWGASEAFFFFSGASFVLGGSGWVFVLCKDL